MDYTLENIPGREFGSVFLTEKSENVAVAVVAAGWSKVDHLSTVFSALLTVKPSQPASQPRWIRPGMLQMLAARLKLDFHWELTQAFGFRHDISSYCCRSGVVVDSRVPTMLS